MRSHVKWCRALSFSPRKHPLLKPRRKTISLLPLLVDQLPPDPHWPRRWSPLPPLATPVVGGRGACSRLIFGVMVYLLGCVIGVVEAALRRINLHQLHSHIGDDLHGCVSELMEMCACWSIGILVFSPFFPYGVVLIHGGARARVRWMLWNKDAHPEMVDCRYFPT
jgi:hypothetical protein